MKTVQLSDKGRVRQHNEDSVGVFTNKNGIVLAIVADGMGGHLAGDVASQMTISSFKKIWDETGGFDSPDSAEKWFGEHLELVNMMLFKHALNNPECQGMGTTFVGVICTDAFATICHIGDSRCYLHNESGFKLMTQDHSLVNELVRSGQITKEDAEHHPRKNVLLRALGTEQQVHFDVTSIGAEQSDILLLCSDGLSNKVSEEHMQSILNSEQQELLNKAETLVQLANENGGEDNISLVLVEYSPGSEKGDEAC
ncbi:Stp1/IreP family PP2C-type Ser/Thr phosphatase [Metabacillus arenae]|uniref:protein-serine/threonine phosphatase n=1 Tax=Metabacillus arenae TaxID=2771434 RepID=A0A926RVS1_9BACI|nr:Stp1/IreP family PP2C-type Ser/Thr phosphatase [Metabacillus arenae]MBD1379998.1 Stp1/IreP family PP2C-type Ser/Thr phosphatase [Metabacillus arenae]